MKSIVLLVALLCVFTQVYAVCPDFDGNQASCETNNCVYYTGLNVCRHPNCSSFNNNGPTCSSQGCVYYNPVCSSSLDHPSVGDHCYYSPCLNGGACVNQINGYSCSCAAGYTGTNCTVNIDECSTSPCKNGGTCVDGIGNYTCICASAYKGVNCTGYECKTSCGNGVCEKKCNNDEDDEFIKLNGATVYETSMYSRNPIAFNQINFTYCFWFYRTHTLQSYPIVQRGYVIGSFPLNNRFLLTGVQVDGSPAMGFYGNDLITNGFKQPLNTWAHHCGLYNQYTLYRAIYTNATFVGANTATVPYQGIGELQVNAGGSWGNGWLDEFRFYSRLLSVDDIYQVYMNQYCNTAALEIYYKFESIKGNNTVIWDFSGNNRHAFKSNTDFGVITKVGTHPVYSNDTQWACTCAAGWTGSNCTRSIDECATSPCKNGATCVDGHLNYTCICDTGYNGTNCTGVINHCTSTSCANNGTCINNRFGFTCNCTSRWIGSNCSTRKCIQLNKTRAA